VCGGIDEKKDSWVLKDHPGFAEDKIMLVHITTPLFFDRDTLLCIPQCITTSYLKNRNNLDIAECAACDKICGGCKGIGTNCTKCWTWFDIKAWDDWLVSDEFNIENLKGCDYKEPFVPKKINEIEDHPDILGP